MPISLCMSLVWAIGSHRSYCIVLLVFVGCVNENCRKFSRLSIRLTGLNMDFCCVFQELQNVIEMIKCSPILIGSGAMN